MKVQSGGCEGRVVCLGKEVSLGQCWETVGYSCELPARPGTKVRDEIPLQINSIGGKPDGERQRSEVLR